MVKEKGKYCATENVYVGDKDTELAEQFREKGIQVLVLDTRTNFLGQKKSVYFNTSYFCCGMLPQDLMFYKMPKKRG